ncbi:hypothetical protein ACJMK2_029540, partial [Sinanodonta woodiana]
PLMQKQVEANAKDGEEKSEYAESSANVQDKHCGPNITMEDGKVSNIMYDSEARRDLKHTDIATRIMLTSNVSPSADIYSGDSACIRE